MHAYSRMAQVPDWFFHTVHELADAGFRVAEGPDWEDRALTRSRLVDAASRLETGESITFDLYNIHFTEGRISTFTLTMTDHGLTKVLELPQ